MGFLNENDSWLISSGLSLTLGFSKTFCFPSSLEGFSRGGGGGGGRRTYFATASCFSWLKKTKYLKRNFFVFYTKFERHTTGDSRETLDRAHVRDILSKGTFMSKTVATFFQTVGFIWQKGGLSLYLFRTQMLLLA